MLQVTPPKMLLEVSLELENPLDKSEKESTINQLIPMNQLLTGYQTSQQTLQTTSPYRLNKQINISKTSSLTSLKSIRTI